MVAAIPYYEFSEPTQRYRLKHKLETINDHRNPRHYFRSHAHGTGDYPAIGAPPFDGG